jgi:hypothetical protein
VVLFAYTTQSKYNNHDREGHRFWRHYERLVEAGELLLVGSPCRRTSEACLVFFQVGHGLKAQRRMGSSSAGVSRSHSPDNRFWEELGWIIAGSRSQETSGTRNELRGVRMAVKRGHVDRGNC